MSKEKQKKVYAASLVDGDTIIETVDAGTQNSFLVCQEGEISYVTEYIQDGVLYYPVPKDRSIIRSGLLSFPETPIAYGRSQLLHGEISSFIARYVSLSSEFRVTLASYIMLSWVYDAFNELPYLRFSGDFGSGKSRALLVSGALAQKSLNAGGASSISPVFHILDTYRGTLLFDEADMRFSDEKSEVVKILNNGNQRGFPLLRSVMNDKKEWEPRAFLVYGPKVVAMRGSYQDQALESRFLTEEMNRNTPEPHIPVSLPNEFYQEAKLLRRKLLTYRLEHFLYLRELKHEQSEVPGRLRQILLPLLAVAPTQEVKEAILEVGRRNTHNLSLERSWSFEFEVMKAIVFLRDKSEQLSVSAITSTLRVQTQREFDRSLSSGLVGRTLRQKLGLSLYKSSGEVLVHPGQDSRLEELEKKYLTTPS
jgi:hypothetical protein